MNANKLLLGSVVAGYYRGVQSCSRVHLDGSMSLREKHGEKGVLTKEGDVKKSCPPILLAKRSKGSCPKAALQTPLIIPGRGVVDVNVLWANLVALLDLIAQSLHAIKFNNLLVQMHFEKGLTRNISPYGVHAINFYPKLEVGKAAIVIGGFVLRTANSSGGFEALIDCRFFTLFAVGGSLIGSILCFAEGCCMILKSYLHYLLTLSQRLDPSGVVHLVIEAIDMFLLGTGMLLFGMGLYSMFVRTQSVDKNAKMIPSWLKTHSLPQAKSRIGHAIMMILQVGFMEKFKSTPLVTTLDLACFAGSLLVSSTSIFLLSKLSSSNLNTI